MTFILLAHLSVFVFPLRVFYSLSGIIQMVHHQNGSRGTWLLLIYHLVLCVCTHTPACMPLPTPQPSYMLTSSSDLFASVVLLCV